MPVCLTVRLQSDLNIWKATNIRVGHDHETGVAFTEGCLFLLLYVEVRLW